MSQTVLLCGSSDANIPRLPPQMAVSDCTPQQMQQLLAQAELESGNVIATHPSPEDLLLAPVLAPLASHHHNSEYSVHKNPNGVNALYCPLSISLPQHIRLLREKQAAFLEANGSELFYFSTDPVSKLNDYLSFPQDIRSPRSPEDETPSTPLAPASSPFLPHDSNTTPNAVGSNLNITEAMNCSILTEKPPMSSLAGSGRVIPELKPPLSNSLSKDLNRALASSLDCLGAKPVRPPFEIRHHSSPNTVTNGCSQTKTSESHPINVAAVIPPNVLPILSSNLQNAPSECTPPQERMSTVFSIPPNLILPYLASLSPVVVMALEHQPSITQRSVEYQGSQIRPPSCPFPSSPHSPQPLTTVLGNENAIDDLCRLNYDGAAANRLRRPRTAPTVATDHAVDLASSLSAVSITTYQPVWGVGDPTGPRSGFYDVGAWRKHTPILGNMILSSCPGKKVRLTAPTPAPVIKTAPSRSAIDRDLTADLERIASLNVKLIINCLSDEELGFLGSPWPKYVAAAHKLGIDILRMPMPEGLAPLTVEDVDREMERVITQYTTKGIDVLAHCRGGIGRAGLVACCWMIKLGVCGTLTAVPRPQTGFVRPDTLALVESAIKVARQRRSLKAIETYEQVKFLVDFVDYLRQKPLITHRKYKRP